jgi:hypothetical protein
MSTDRSPAEWFKLHNDAEEELGCYACTHWMAGDVQSWAEEQGVTITEEQAKDWLGRNAKYIADRLVEVGWDVIGDLINLDDLKE